ncbi:hypothetical protein D918_00509 [Trichuris suis]|nr:hypothetical protein D918_00509 [Trichuris suis]
MLLVVPLLLPIPRLPVNNTNGITFTIPMVYDQLGGYDRFGDSATNQTQTTANLLVSGGGGGGTATVNLSAPPINLNQSTTNASGVDGSEGNPYGHHQQSAGANSFNSACPSVAAYGHLPAAAAAVTANGYGNQAHQSSMLFASPGVAAQSVPTQLMGLGGYPPYAWISRSCK